ncbi:hypothetical protein JET68_05195 [Pseudomonas monteilii]|uniref:hypothetical protein n=1 Tax=Pseudomonas putida group TaxID=136845 RepID=UPI00125DBAB4|nr:MULTISPECIES: hypothetical protein [Pseudomonas putida group]MBI6918188.1 hypothetical protein [Pseudomonas monteilii]
MTVEQKDAFKSLDAGDLYSGEYLSVATVQADYSLSATEHVILKNQWVSIYGWALNVGFATFGYFLSILPKLLAYLENSANPSVAKGEWIALAFGSVAVVVLCLVGSCWPNDRKKLLKAIDEHFAKAPKSRQRVRG